MNIFIINIIAILLGQVIGHLNKKMPPVVAEEITYKEFFSTILKDFKVDYIYSIIMLIISNMLTYFLGVDFLTYLYIIISSILVIVFVIDYKIQLIPDEAHIALAMLGIMNIIVTDMTVISAILGALTGGGIFFAIALLALIIYKKEGMGFGDVKLMAALGFIFGVKTILVVSLVSFFIGAIIGGILMIIKKKDGQSYIPFGPFIVIATFIIMVVDPQVIIDMYIGLCMAINTGVSDLIWMITN